MVTAAQSWASPSASELTGSIWSQILGSGGRACSTQLATSHAGTWTGWKHSSSWTQPHPGTRRASTILFQPLRCCSPVPRTATRSQAAVGWALDQPRANQEVTWLLHAQRAPPAPSSSLSPSHSCAALLVPCPWCSLIPCLLLQHPE